MNNKMKRAAGVDTVGRTVSHPKPWRWSSDQILLKTWRVREAQEHLATEPQKEDYVIWKVVAGQGVGMTGALTRRARCALLRMWHEMFLSKALVP